MDERRVLRATRVQVMSRAMGEHVYHPADAHAALERVRTAELEARKKQAGSAYQESEADKQFAEALDLYKERPELRG